jgi:hypothetical protein
MTTTTVATPGQPVIRKAERRKSKLRLALCGPSGSGKTMSALQLAFGLDAGAVGMIDTENGSGDLYADLGDYDIITLSPPYTVQKYREAIRAFEAAGHGVIIVDSLSHAWAGEGGLLDRQGQLEASGRYKNSFATWREITPEQNKLIEQLLASRAHIIATLRSKMEWVVDKDERGKSTVRKVGLAPVQRDGITFEFTVVMDVADNHMATASKDRTALLDGWCDRITRDTGRMLRHWLESGCEPLPQSAVAADIEHPQPAAVAPMLPRSSGRSPESGPRKLTNGEWLQTLRTRLDRCTERSEVEAMLLTDEVCRAANTLTGAAREKLTLIIDAALARDKVP